MSKSKCTCPPDYDCCVCGYERPPKKVIGIKQTTSPVYCRACLDDGALVRLVLKPVHGNSRREHYCTRCATKSGAGYYEDGGYTAQKAKVRLREVQKRAAKLISQVDRALETLDTQT